MADIRTWSKPVILDDSLPHLADYQHCSGCGACVNVCPVGALSMGYEQGPFLSYQLDAAKCIGCKRCEKACPSLNPIFENERYPKFYAYCAPDDVRAVSSSGGMFTMLARYVLARGGVVCGAAYDENLQLHHTFAESEEDIAKFRGSKYFQSNIEDCYKRIKDYLKDGRWVLFTGTPCQVAALRGVLGRTYDNLLTADLLCHGTPSQKFFDAYVEENARGRHATDVAFRSKRFGWSWSRIVTSYDDGTERVGSLRQGPKDLYMLAFNKNLMMRPVCYDCQFCGYPRQGDITIGDLWEWQKLDPNSNDKKGTSFVFVNNEKGMRVFEELEQDAAYSNEIELKPERYDKLPNRVRRKTKPHGKRGRFLKLFETETFTDSVRMAINGVYDIGLPTVLYGANIGSVLTYWSLYYTLSDMGYTVKTFEKPRDAKLKDSNAAISFCKKWLPDYAVPQRYNSIFDMRSLNNNCRQFLVGSDQVFFQDMNDKRGDMFFLEFVMGSHGKSAYATSFGGPGGRGSKAYYDKVRLFLNRFDRISVREDDGVDFANNTLQLDKPVEFAMDPVFLVNPDYLHKLADAAEVDFPESYVGSYVVKTNDRIVGLLRSASEHHGGLTAECAVHLLDEKTANKYEGIDCYGSWPMERTIRTIRDAKFVVTDSYHGVCLSLIFGKQFITCPRDFPDRFVTLLKRLGLEDRIIMDTSDDQKVEAILALEPIDYEVINPRIEELIAHSREILQDSLDLGAEPHKLTDLDLAMEYIVKQDRKLDEQQKLIDEQKARIDELQGTLDRVTNDLNTRIEAFEYRWGKIASTFPYAIYKKLKR